MKKKKSDMNSGCGFMSATFLFKVLESKSFPKSAFSFELILLSYFVVFVLNIIFENKALFF